MDSMVMREDTGYYFLATCQILKIYATLKTYTGFIWQWVRQSVKVPGSLVYTLTNSVFPAETS